METIMPHTDPVDGILAKKIRQQERGDESNPSLACLHPQPDNYISAKQYVKKYGLELAKVRNACNKGVMISSKREVKDFGHNRMVLRWFVLDIPPKDHPGFEEYTNRQIRRPRPMKVEELADGALLKRFNEARLNCDQSDFSQREVAEMCGVGTATVKGWGDAGVEGWGKLPKIIFTDDKEIMDDAGIVETFYRQEDILRFLRGELKDPNKKFKTISDKVQKTNADLIAAKHGYYVPSLVKRYPMNYEGFILWAEDNVCRYDKSKDRWIPFRAIEMQRECYKEVWKLKPDGRLKHRFIRLCRPRGEMKSFDAIIIALFRFFNMQREKILFAANSKDQSDYSLYDETKDIVLNSPKLAETPGLEVREKEIRIMSGKREIFSRIQSIATKQGSLSNATCIVFSEIHKLQDQSFIVELEGSIRLVPNAMSIIESTVSRIGTYYHRQYEVSLTDKDPLLYFQYYCDKNYNPNMTQEELDHYRLAFFPEEFEMYFINRWGDAGSGLFSMTQIKEMGYIGLDGRVNVDSEAIKPLVKELIEVEARYGQLEGQTDTRELETKLNALRQRLYPVDKLYNLPATRVDIEKLISIFGEDYAIGIGLDRAEQLVARADRSAMGTIGKWYINADEWIAFLLDLYLPKDSSLGLFTDRILRNTEEFGFISQIEVEKSQGLDLVNWCNDNNYPATLSVASYEHQYEIFLEFWKRLKLGLFKAPTVPLWVDDKGVVHSETPPFGKKDILRWEMDHFIHEVKSTGGKAGYFGSEFKRKTGRTKPGEAKDDTIYGIGHGVFAANIGELSALMMGKSEFSGAYINTELMGNYK
jgi:hypothetical protein